MNIRVSPAKTRRGVTGQPRLLELAFFYALNKDGRRRTVTVKDGQKTTQLQVEDVRIDELRPDAANPRRIGNAELEALTRSIREYGLVQPVLARREDNTVVGGHQRLVAARRLGHKSVPVIFLDLSLEQARLLNLGLNKISGEWDQELLARLLVDLKP